MNRTRPLFNMATARAHALCPHSLSTGIVTGASKPALGRQSFGMIEHFHHATSVVHTPIGRVEVRVSMTAIIGLIIEHHGQLPADVKSPGTSALSDVAASHTSDLIAGVRDRVDIPVWAPGTDFQRSVWRAIRAVPRGSTTSYAELARTIRRPTALRAVGSAVARVPVPILIPSHRVINARGQISGFDLGEGPKTKARLLEIEGAILA